MAKKRVETTRISVVVPVEHARTLERIAERDRVSVSHVAAMAIERAVIDEEGGLLVGMRTATVEVSSAHPRARSRRRVA